MFVPLVVAGYGAKLVSHFLKVDVELPYLRANRQKTGIRTGVAHVRVLSVGLAASGGYVSSTSSTGSVVI